MDSATNTMNTGLVTPQLLASAEQFVRKELAQHDGSHDFFHVARVADSAKRLAKEEGLSPESIALCELCALLHDVRDYKYSGCERAGGDAVQEFLSSQGAPQQLTDQVLAVIASIGFKDELAAAGGRPQLSPEAAVVQDADRLDAIGAVGIARCFTFGGRFNRVLYDPEVLPRTALTKEAYVKDAAKSTTINHFYEKLLKLKDLMKTASGRRLAEQRHAVMEQFLEQFHAECEGRA